MKIKLSLICCMILLFTTPAVPVSAAEVSATEIEGVIDINNLPSGLDVQISDVMTYEEMLTVLSSINPQAVASMPAMASNVSTADLTYRTFSVRLKVTDEYIPNLQFFCETAEGGHFFNILSIYSVQLVRSYGNISKQFSGAIDVWLRSSTSIEYVVNGDFFNNGTTTSTEGANVGIGITEGTTVTYSCSTTTTSNHYKYFFVHETQKYA